MLELEKKNLNIDNKDVDEETKKKMNSNGSSSALKKEGSLSFKEAR